MRGFAAQNAVKWWRYENTQIITKSFSSIVNHMRKPHHPKQPPKRGRPPDKWVALAASDNSQPGYAVVWRNRRSGARRYRCARSWKYLHDGDDRIVIILGNSHKGFAGMTADARRAIASRGGLAHSVAHLREIGRHGADVRWHSLNSHAAVEPVPVI